MKIEKAIEISDAKIQFVSLVDKAANRRQFLITKADAGQAQFSTLGKILKTDAETHYVTGVVYEPLAEDAHGNFMTADEIRKAAYWFAKNGDKVDLQHSFEQADGLTVVETYVAPSDMEIEGEPVVKGTWLMTVEVENAEVWDKVQKGEITGFSMGGVGKYSETETELPETVEKRGILKKLAGLLGVDAVEKGEVRKESITKYSPDQARDENGRFSGGAATSGAAQRTSASPSGSGKFSPSDFQGSKALAQAATELQNEFEKRGQTGITEHFNGTYGSATLKIGPFDSIALETNSDGTFSQYRWQGAAYKTPQYLCDKLEGKRVPDYVDQVAKTLDLEGKWEAPTKDAPVEKAGKKISGKNRDTLQSIYDNLGSLLAEFADEEKEETEVTKAEVQTIVDAAVQKALEGAVKTEETPATEPALTAEAVEKMVTEAVRKALEPKDETMTAEAVQAMVDEAVQKAVEPVLKARGLSSNLNDEKPVEKTETRHYLAGIL